MIEIDLLSFTLVKIAQKRFKIQDRSIFLNSPPFLHHFISQIEWRKFSWKFRDRFDNIESMLLTFGIAGKNDVLEKRTTRRKTCSVEHKIVESTVIIFLIYFRLPK